MLSLQRRSTQCLICTVTPRNTPLPPPLPSVVLWSRSIPTSYHYHTIKQKASRLPLRVARGWPTCTSFPPLPPIYSTYKYTAGAACDPKNNPRKPYSITPIVQDTPTINNAKTENAHSDSRFLSLGEGAFYTKRQYKRLPDFLCSRQN